MPNPTDAEALRQVLSDLATLNTAQLVRLWRSFSDLSGFEQVVSAALPDVVAPQITAASMVTAQWYTETAPELAYKAAPTVDPIPAERIQRTVSWAFHAPGQSSPLDRLAGSTQRMVFDASRETVLENLENEVAATGSPFPAGTRWARYASATACPFCRMLATRGAVYWSKESAGASTKYHDHCRCIAVPVRPGQSYEPPSYVEQWEKDYVDAVDAAKKGRKSGGEHGAVDPKDILRHMTSA
ncbi:head maturation protease [Mycobacterium phage Quico]|uniref:head maturation protease n=1 Tax=Mycobacterium phage Quico TaxID=1675555 RepID=UPI0006A2E339|nr:head maturation protease [Mycobacterium phage Quico]AKU45092.1 capsid maturation protease [Mycobacterium phage Girafales]AKU45588.1 head maturation protease [Mycobacterium phage Quico]